MAVRFFLCNVAHGNLLLVRNKTLNTLLHFYDKAWFLATPLLRLNKRLKDGYSQRKLINPLPRADIWIQAASGGEAYLAWTLLKHLRPEGPIRILVTTNTRQGMDIISHAIDEVAVLNPKLIIFQAWFPFDRPMIMNRAVAQVNPKLAVLLESELWPGFMYALKSQDCPVFIINGRMTQKSMAGFLRFPDICHKLRPDHILAISNDDSKRFGKVFGKEGLSVMSNMKFDRLAVEPGQKSEAEKANRLLNKQIPDDIRFLVLGSVRHEEERQVAWILQEVYRRRPDIVTGLFPRHMNRLDHWKKTIATLKVKWRLRSEMNAPAQKGEVILWDVFGELSTAYASARAVFVGGSLAPLGGQNFLEPLIYDIVPVIGPFYENFAWVGEDIFSMGLVVKAKNKFDVANHLISQLDNPAPDVASRARKFITARQGGTHQACDLIEKALHERRMSS